MYFLIIIFSYTMSNFSPGRNFMLKNDWNTTRKQCLRTCRK